MKNQKVFGITWITIALATVAWMVWMMFAMTGCSDPDCYTPCVVVTEKITITPTDSTTTEIDKQPLVLDCDDRLGLTFNYSFDTVFHSVDSTIIHTTFTRCKIKP